MPTFLDTLFYHSKVSLKNIFSQKMKIQQVLFYSENLSKLINHFGQYLI